MHWILVDHTENSRLSTASTGTVLREKTPDTLRWILIFFIDRFFFENNEINLSEFSFFPFSMVCNSYYCLLAFPVDCWFYGSISVVDCIDSIHHESFLFYFRFFSVTKNTSIRGTSPDQNVLHGILKYSPDENATPTLDDTKRKRGWWLIGIFG